MRSILQRSIVRIVFFLIILLELSIIHPQDNNKNENAERRIGFTAAIQNNQTDIMIPIWTSERFVLAPALSAIYVSDGGTDIAAGFAFRVYPGIKKISPYWGGRFGALIQSPKDRDSKTDFLAGLMFGGEYFLHPQFSFGIEVQLNASFSDNMSYRFNNPGGTNLYTATVILANIYF